MPKATHSAPSWRDEPITEAQVTKLLIMLREAEVIEAERGCPLEEYEDEAVDWVNENQPRSIQYLSEITKGEIQKLFEELGE